MQYYDAALSIDPNATDILGNKGYAANSVIGLYNKGTCLDKLGQHIQAKGLHDKAPKIHPNYTADYQNIVAVAS